ncbi:MAG: M48 family metalloprotease [Steroidobacteraceae bacterium]|jgi:predicted Zn-dependent protease|nr:M48 family metalloprotease [Steroidobacteraceae bacterium]
MTRIALPALAAAVLLLAAGCATNPVSGKSDLAFMSQEQERKIGQQMHVQITQTMGVYDDARLQEYVQQLGEKLAKQSHRPELDWKFTVIDTDDVNAFATPGGFVYISRGILPYLASEAELAAVIGHEIAHITARHSVQRQSQSTVAGVLGAAAAIFTGQPALGDLAGIAGQAVISGYGREQELEADRLGAEYLARTGYDPNAIIRVVRVLKEQEMFERDRARAEGRNPRIYHGVFASHPDNDRRLQEAVAAAAKVEGRATGTDENVEAFLRRIDGLAFGSSRRQGMVRDNRFYHGDFQFTMAFPQGWKIQNDPNQLLAASPDRNNVMQLTAQAPPGGLTNPRDFTLRGLGDRRLDRSESLTINGLDAFTTIVRGDNSPFGTTSNVRYVVVYHNNLMWILRGASRAGAPAPEGDVLFTSAARTFRPLRSDEFRLAEPNRLRIVKAPENASIADLASRSPLTTYAVEQHRLFNGLYPSGEPTPGSLVKVVR